ncbi:12702_t:CDS:2 [Acaulospora morrowiae]|uniref:12702_t:CDS:1 n=1 Tax=Acaulospora morrowiae TaxID=94023 RepID=A0A9N8Z6Z8_9GLOM|nr:12702_t:CDS:2 [Acaulospora morrowiae]
MASFIKLFPLKSRTAPRFVYFRYNLFYKNRSIGSRCLHQNASLEPVTQFTAKKSPKRHLVFDNSSPSFEEFLKSAALSSIENSATTIDGELISQENVKPTWNPIDSGDQVPSEIPYFDVDVKSLGKNTKYYVEVYGCQMNVNDTEILISIMNDSGYLRTEKLAEADIIFLVTCAIRDKAESKIWQRLNALRNINSKLEKDKRHLIGVLGCMAERLKTKLLDADKLVDIVCGPDAYRSIPHLLSLAIKNSQGVANVMLSADETYADIMPVRLHNGNISAFLSIMRFEFMKVIHERPFVAGRRNASDLSLKLGIERSRPMYPSIIEEVKTLSKQGVKEVTLLGQNVNSYRDTKEYNFYNPTGVGDGLSNEGFKTIYRRKEGGIRFTELLDNVSLVDPEMRIRFTSPHPKDFPIELLNLIAERPNICNQIHLPVQSGNTNVLKRMRRGYSREAYLDLVHTIRDIIPDVSLSTDIITGFCGETEEEHQDTLSLLEIVKFDMAYMFAYSMREKTHAHRNYNDDVPKTVKVRRLNEIIRTFYDNAKIRFSSLIGKPQLALIEGYSRRDKQRLRGLTDGGHKIYFDDVEVIDCTNMNNVNFKNLGLESILTGSQYSYGERYVSRSSFEEIPRRSAIKSGDYVMVIPTSTTGSSFDSIPIAKMSIAQFSDGKFDKNFAANIGV